MRRGFFVSLAAVLLIGIILISVIATQDREEAQTQLDLMNLENRLAANYIDVLTDVTIPREIAKATKNELKDDAGRPNNLNALRGAIFGDVQSAVASEHERLGLPFDTIALDSLSLTAWEHVDPWTISIDYTYDLTARSDRGIEWTVIDEPGEVEFSIVGFEHPDSSFSAGGKITREFWVENATTADNVCFLDEISSYACGTVKPVCPLVICR